MTDKVKRYSFGAADECYKGQPAEMHEDAGGEWVEFEDCKRIRDAFRAMTRRAEKAERELAFLRVDLSKVRLAAEEMRKSLDAASGFLRYVEEVSMMEGKEGRDE